MPDKFQITLEVEAQATVQPLTADEIQAYLKGQIERGDVLEVTYIDVEEIG